jgi:ubiquinone biosynthesis UbiH/UbiF/VisC/COQ6 family hydroxylase
MRPHITIVGAGPAGLSFARSLANTGLQVTIVEKRPATELGAPAFDGRDIALTHRSVRILKELGVWARIDPAAIGPIRQARVLDGTSGYPIDFDREDESVEPLGYIISNHLIRQALFDEVETVENVNIITDVGVTSLSTNSDRATAELSNGQTLESSLIVAADARFSAMRRMMGIPASMQDFGRVALVCRLAHDRPHRQIAFECFHYGRTLAVLPLNGNQSSVVITAPTDIAHDISEMSEDQFNRDVMARFEHRLGDMRLVSERHTYPLVAVHATKFKATRFALIGDAAVGMHPVTAHGFNLGLSGQEILAGEVRNALSADKDIGDPGLLGKYQRKHMRATRPMYAGTNHIVRFFTDDRLPAKMLRKASLRVINNLAPVKAMITSQLTEAEDARPWSLQGLPLKISRGLPQKLLQGLPRIRKP